MRGFAQNADAGPQHEKADGQAEEWVDPAQAGHVNGDGADEDGDVGEGVAEIVHQDTAEIQVAAAFDESEGDAAVYGQGGEGRPIIQLSTTSTGALKRAMASQANQSESMTRTRELVKAASVPARW